MTRALIRAISSLKKNRDFFGCSVIEYLNYDPWSGHDTFDQKVLLRVISARVKDPQVDFLVFMCVMSRPMVIIKVLYDTKIDQEIQGGHPVKKYD